MPESSCFVSCLLSLTDRLGFETRNYWALINCFVWPWLGSSYLEVGRISRGTIIYHMSLDQGHNQQTKNTHWELSTRTVVATFLILNFILQVLPCKWWNPAYHCWSNSSIQNGKLWQQKRCGVVSTDPSPPKKINKYINKSYSLIIHTLTRTYLAPCLWNDIKTFLCIHVSLSVAGWHGNRA